MDRHAKATTTQVKARGAPISLHDCKPVEQAVLLDALSVLSSRTVRKESKPTIPREEYVDDDPVRAEAVRRARGRFQDDSPRRTSPPRGNLWKLLLNQEKNGVFSITVEGGEMVLTVRHPSRPPVEFKFPRGMEFRKVTNHPNSPNRKSLYRCLAAALLPPTEVERWDLVTS